MQKIKTDKIRTNTIHMEQTIDKVYVIQREVDDRYQIIGIFIIKEEAEKILQNLTKVLNDYKESKQEYPDIENYISIDKYEQAEKEYYETVDWYLEDTQDYTIEEWETNKIL